MEESIARIKEVKDLPLESLLIAKGQVRVKDVGKGIDELAMSIRKVGLLEPIVVAPADEPGKFEIITGQRRFLAHERIQAKTIQAAILDRSVDELTAKVISVTENLVRLDLGRTDLIDVCTYLYKRYGTVTAVVEKTGLPKSKVDAYVKYDRLVPELKELVDQAGIDVKVALRAQDATAAAGEFEAETAVALAKEMANMSGAQQAKIVATTKDEPGKTVDEILEEAKSAEKITQIVVTLGASVHAALRRFATDEGTNQDDAAGSLIQESLELKGMIVED